MFTDLPRPLVSKTGFQGCFASFETNGELLDPVKHALVPSPLVEEGCEGTLIHYILVLPVLFLLGGRLFFQSVFTNHGSQENSTTKLPWFVLLEFHKP